MRPAQEPLMFSYAAVSKRIARKLGLSATEVDIVAQTIRRKSWAMRNGPGLLGAGTFFAWMFIFWRGMGLLEKTRLDVLGALHRWGTFGLVLGLLLGWGVGLFLAGVVAVLVCERMLRRRIEAMPRDRGGGLCVCDECLYPMEHAEPGDVSRCPECGTEYFRRGAPSGRGLPR